MKNYLYKKGFLILALFCLIVVTMQAVQSEASEQVVSYKGKQCKVLYKNRWTGNLRLVDSSGVEFSVAPEAIAEQ